MVHYSSLLIFVALTIIAVSCGKTNKLDCTELRTGKFYLKGDAPKVEYILERTDSIQDEIEKQTGNISRYRIKWINSCEYELLFMYRVIKDSSANVKEDDMKKKVRQFPIRVKITNIKKDHFTISASIEGIDYNVKTTIWILK